MPVFNVITDAELLRPILTSEEVGGQGQCYFLLASSCWLLPCFML